MDLSPFRVKRQIKIQVTSDRFVNVGELELFLTTFTPDMFMKITY